MSEKYIFTVLGGDLRQATVAEKLLSLGHTVRIFGMGTFSSELVGADNHMSVEKAVLGADAVILPLPVSRDNMFLNLAAANTKDAVSLADIVKHASQNKKSVIVGGIIPSAMSDIAEKLGISIYDYYLSEKLQRKNALPSAEGAIMIAMENTDRNIEGMNVLISGFGRIGSLLAQKLKALGASVTIAARRDEVLCDITMSGYDAVRSSDIDAMRDSINTCEVVFNTVPSVIFTKQILDGVKNKPIYIEIASSPGGIDIPCARVNGLAIQFAPSLPGKYAPVSAGEYIFDEISEIFAKRGMTL